MQNNSFCMNFASRIRIQTNKKFKTSMKKTMILLAALLLVQLGRAANDDVVLTIDGSGATPLEQQLQGDWQQVDSLVLTGGPYNEKMMEVISRFMDAKSVRGVNASNARFKDDELPYRAFYFVGYHALHYIMLPSTLKRLGEESLYLTPIAELVVPEGVNELGFNCLSECRDLQRLQLPSTLTTLDPYALFRLTSLQELQLPASLKRIGVNALAYLGDDVTSVVVPNSVEVIGNGAFYHCMGLQQVVLPQVLDSIEQNTFWACNNLGQVTWPVHLQSIGLNAFCLCNLSEALLPDGVERIGSYAFSANYNLSVVVLPPSLKEMCASTFAWDDAIKSLTCLATTPPTVIDDAQDRYSTPPANATLYVPEASIDAYRQAFYWGQFREIVGINVSGVQSAATGKPAVITYYNINGLRQSQPRQGLNIVLHADGSTMKMIRK